MDHMEKIRQFEGFLAHLGTSITILENIDLKGKNAIGNHLTIALRVAKDVLREMDACGVDGEPRVAIEPGFFGYREIPPPEHN